jgi:AcrR family transcriptional regulator
MTLRKNQPVSLRKKPQQNRSNDLVAVVLEAAVQVLEREGAGRFTMARVAERAGVSVGSIYQYFPNKAAVLFRLQSDEWRQTTEMMRETLLGNPRVSPLVRLRSLVHAFVRSECDEAAVRAALDDAAPLYRDAPETREAMAAGDEIMTRFMKEVLPDAPEATRDVATNLISSTLTETGKEFSESSPTRDEELVFSDAMADMFSCYLRSLQRRKNG